IEVIRILLAEFPEHHCALLKLLTYRQEASPLLLGHARCEPRGRRAIRKIHATLCHNSQRASVGSRKVSASAADGPSSSRPLGSNESQYFSQNVRSLTTSPPNE